MSFGMYLRFLKLCADNLDVGGLYIRTPQRRHNPFAISAIQVIIWLYIGPPYKVNL